MSFSYNPQSVASPVGGYPDLPIDPASCDAEGVGLDTLEAALVNSGTMTVDGMTVSGPSVSDIMKMDQYLIGRKKRCTNASAWGLLGKAKVIPPNAASGE